MARDLAFAVNSQVLELLIRAGASIRNPDIEPPVTRSDKSGRYLEMRINSDPEEPAEGEIVRRIAVDDLSIEKWKELEEECANLQLQACVDNGLSKELENIRDEQIRRLVYTLLTFLNPRQVAIVLYLYREATREKMGSRIHFNVNDLLETLGYSRARNGFFPAKYRSQLHRDLVALHRTELLFAGSSQGAKNRTKLMFKSILRIKDVDLDNLPRDFDIMKAAEDGYGSADAYTVELEFFEAEGGNSVLFSDSFDFRQKAFSSTQDDYETKLLILLASRIRKKQEEFLVLSKRCLYKSLDLLGSNKGRNTKLLWRTIESLSEQGYILKARELPGKRYSTSIEFQLSNERIRCSA